MTRVLPLPAPARISTGPSVVLTASRCCGLSWSRKDNAEVAPETLIQFYRGIGRRGLTNGDFPLPISDCRSHGLEEAPIQRPVRPGKPRTGKPRAGTAKNKCRGR